jgi:hypothetical protein
VNGFCFPRCAAELMTCSALALSRACGGEDFKEPYRGKSVVASRLLGKYAKGVSPSTFDGQSKLAEAKRRCVTESGMNLFKSTSRTARATCEPPARHERKVRRDTNLHLLPAVRSVLAEFTEVGCSLIFIFCS